MPRHKLTILNPTVAVPDHLTLEETLTLIRAAYQEGYDKGFQAGLLTDPYYQDLRDL